MRQRKVVQLQREDGFNAYIHIVYCHRRNVLFIFLAVTEL